MSIFPFLHFFSFITYCFLAVYILIKNPKALVNRISTIFFLCFGLWSLTFIFFHSPTTTKSEAQLLTNIGAFGWIGFSALFLWFVLVFTGRVAILKKKWFYPVLFGIPLLLIYKQWDNYIFVDYVLEWFGWRGVYGKTIWPYLFFLQYATFVTAGLYLIFKFIKKTGNQILKKQAKIIFVSMTISVLLGSLTDVVSILFQVRSIPNIADFFVLTWACGVSYAIVKYKFLVISPFTAAENIIATMFDSLILMDPNGNIVRVNNAVIKLLGYREEELIGKSLNMLLKGEKKSKQENTQDLLSEIRDDKEIKTREVIFRSRENQEIPVMISGSLLKDDSGSIAGIVCVGKDISERRKLKEELLKSKKLESIGLLAGGIAHDFNNLLAVIIGNVGLMQAKLEPSDPRIKLIKKVEDASNKTAQLAKKFITFSRGGWVKKEAIDIENLLTQLDLEHLAVSISNQPVTFRLDMDPHLKHISGDPSQLMEVLRYIFLNALEAIPATKKGHIVVKGENTDFVQNTNDRAGFFLKKGEYIKLSIRDNGVGISAQDIQKVFDPYFSTKNILTEQGVGLGLTICYSILKKHGGHIALESKSEQGTLVTLYLPVDIPQTSIDI
jgi:PAS domain S-box-containing protein